MSKTRYLTQVSLRDILGLITIVALGISLFLSQRDNRRMRERYSQLFPQPHVLLWSSAGQERHANSGSIGVAGTLYHSTDNALAKTPTITVQLIDPLSRKVIAEATDHNMVPNVKGHDFGLTLRRSGSVPNPGIYFVLVEAFVDATPIARACTAMELIDWRTIGTETPHVPNDSSVGSSP